MTVDISRAPFPIAVRELWLPRAINGTLLPSSRFNGHPLTLAGGARLGSTTDGCRFRGGATDNLKIVAHGDQQNKAAFHVTIRFRFPEGYAAGDGTVYLFSWDNGGFDYIRLWFNTADGKIYFEQGDVAAGNEFQLVGTLTTWVAGQWYTITARLQDTPEQELYEDGVSVASSAVATPIDTPAGGDIIIGNSTDGGVNGAKVDISFVHIGMGATAVVAINDAEAALLAKGIPTLAAKSHYYFLMDEGRGTTVANRRTGTGDGVLDTGVVWVFGECKHPILSLDGIDDYGQSPATMDISGDVTVVWAGKIKARYPGTGINLRFIQLWLIGNMIQLFFRFDESKVRFQVYDGVNNNLCDYAVTEVIDDYVIFLGVQQPAVGASLYVNGSLADFDAGGAVLGPANTAAYLGSDHGVGRGNVSRALMVGLFNTAWDAKQARVFSRWLNEIFHLGLTI